MYGSGVSYVVLKGYIYDPIYFYWAKTVTLSIPLVMYQCSNKILACSKNHGIREVNASKRDKF